MPKNSLISASEGLSIIQCLQARDIDKIKSVFNDLTNEDLSLLSKLIQYYYNEYE